jgi:N6-adenosine-specific RNA methylase IME4
MSTQCFRVLVADPPWSFGDKLPGASRGAEKNYRVLTLKDIEAFPLPPMADDSLLLLWRVSSQVEEAYRVVRAWGFEPKSEIVWRKLTPSGKAHFGMGRYVRAAHESCIVARRGRFKPRSRSVRSVFEAATGAHSQKPDEFYDLVEELAEGPYVELFARRARIGWCQFGDQLPGGAASPERKKNEK